MSLDTLAEKQVVMDGKELRGGSPESPASQGDCLPGAWVGENHIMVGQLPLNGKENEIAAIPRLLDKLDLAGAVVSMDAMGTQVDIAQKILDKRAHYILSVKDNQEALQEVVTDATRFGKPFDTSSEMEDKAIPHRWLGMETLVEIEPEVIMGEKKNHHNTSSYQ